MDTRLAGIGMIDLIEALKQNTWPRVFLEDLLGLTKKTASLLPGYALRFLMLYFLAAICVLVLKLWKKQRSFSDLVRKLIDCISIFVGVMWLWIAPQFIAQAKGMAAGIEGSFSFSAAGFQWYLDQLQVWFEPLFIVVLLFAIATLPVWTIVRYLKSYKLWGIFWSVYDTGFGLVILSAAILSMWHGDVRWYFMILPALVLVWLGQRGGTDVK